MSRRTQRMENHTQSLNGPGALQPLHAMCYSRHHRNHLGEVIFPIILVLRKFRLNSHKQMKKNQS